MPEICRFLGIVITMYYKEHAPPHFHAKYGEYRGVFSINDLRITEGELPKKLFHLFWNGRLNIEMNCLKTGSLLKERKISKKSNLSFRI
jgi:hypothetical protein